jgi:uncharacterized membrane protein (DUF485 family)
MVEPSRQYNNLSRWQQPHSWLSGAAIGILVLSVIILIGFVRGYLETAITYLGWYFAGESAIPYIFFVITASATIPTIGSVIGAAILLLSQKKELGIYLTLTAIGMYFIMDAVFIGFFWDGNHVFQSYTHAEWLIRSFSAYGDYMGSVYAFYLVYIPALVGITLSILQGRKKLKRFPT